MQKYLTEKNPLKLSCLILPVLAIELEEAMA